MTGLDDEERRARLRAMKPEDLAALADLIAGQRDKIPAEIRRLKQTYRDLNDWLAEFAPGRADDRFDAMSDEELDAWLRAANDDLHEASS